MRPYWFIAALFAAFNIPLVWPLADAIRAAGGGEAESPANMIASLAFISLVWFGACFAFSKDVETAEFSLWATLQRD